MYNNVCTHHHKKNYSCLSLLHALSWLSLSVIAASFHICDGSVYFVTSDLNNEHTGGGGEEAGVLSTVERLSLSQRLLNACRCVLIREVSPLERCPH